MAQVVRVIDDVIYLNGEEPYRAQVCGRPNGHIWEGWIEFIAADGSVVRRTPRETTQPDRDALVYWAHGLSMTYLEGAMARTLTRLKVTVREVPKPYFDAPEPSPVVVGVHGERPTEVDRAVLDPFSVGAKGEELLRAELGALRDWHLRNIIRAYDLADPSLDIERLSTPALIELIVAAVQPV
jgi:hypothetical protein